MIIINAPFWGVFILMKGTLVLGKKLSTEDCHELAKKNFGSFLDDEYRGSKVKHSWRCIKGHVFLAKYNDLQQGGWCPTCSNCNKKDIDYCKALAKQLNGECLSDKYKNNKEKLLWMCDKGHTWLARLYTIQGGHWCPFCANQRKSFDEVKEFTEKNTNFTLVDLHYKNSKTPIQLVCEESHHFKKRWDDIKRGSGCPFCAVEKRKDSYRKKYGVDNPLKCEELKQKQRKTIEERYGVKNISQSPKVKERKAKRQRLPSSNVKGRLKDLFGDQVRLDEASYVDTQTKCFFIDKDFGLWEAVPTSVLQGRSSHPTRARQKRITSLLEKYGVDNPAKLTEFRLKAAKTKNQITEINHWKTGETLHCRGSYEVAVVNYFNENNINFQWQPKTFQMPGGRTYTPDLYLVGENRWVEVKGYFYDDAEEKWLWFHKVHPNSELWNKEKLKQMKIL